jgi:Fe-S-cluster containining protein
MQCHDHCAACCIVISISSPLPGMPEGKPAGVPCIHLTADLECGIYNDPARPAVCIQFKADPEVCGTSREEAFTLLQALEQGEAP